MTTARLGLQHVLPPGAPDRSDSDDDPLTLEALETQTERLLLLIRRAKSRNNARLVRSLRLELLATRHQLVQLRRPDATGSPAGT